MGLINFPHPVEEIIFARSDFSRVISVVIPGPIGRSIIQAFLFFDMVLIPKIVYKGQNPIIAVKINKRTLSQAIVFQKPLTESFTANSINTIPARSLITRSAMPKFCLICV